MSGIIFHRNVNIMTCIFTSRIHLMHILTLYLICVCIKLFNFKRKIIRNSLNQHTISNALSCTKELIFSLIHKSIYYSGLGNLVKNRPTCSEACNCTFEQRQFGLKHQGTCVFILIKQELHLKNSTFIKWRIVYSSFFCFNYLFNKLFFKTIREGQLFEKEV